MKCLQSLVHEYGEPSALIDHHDSSMTGFAIWGWTDIIELSNEKLEISGETIFGDALKSLQTTFDNWKSSSDGISAVGFFSYDAKNLFFPHIAFKPTIDLVPKFWFGKPERIEKYHLNEPQISKSEYSKFLKLVDNSITKEKYIQDLRSIRDNLEKGNVYQVNYTFPRKFMVNADPFQLYLELRKVAIPENGFYINTGHASIISLSPERFIRTRGGRIETFPIKGTRKRQEDHLLDRFLAKQLSESEKDKAEHLMIVDLMRNDLGKICDFGSVQVDDLFKIYSFPSVHHMISKVYGKLRNEIREIDIFRATFPGGSITGAPKESAMQIIDDLENYSRGVYTGSIGFIKPNGNIDFNIAIRTMTVREGIGVYPVGGGIVWDSDPNDEWNEAFQKSMILSPLMETIIES